MSSTAQYKLSVIIVNYNVKYYVEQCLLSVQKALNGINAEVFVVDNHSRDASVEYLTDRFPHVRVISSNHNLGFARANNIAIRQCTGQYVLLLNPDTIVAEDTFHRVLSFMDATPQAGGVGVRMLNVNGSNAMESRRGIPSPLTSFYKMVGLCARYPKSRRFGRYYLSFLPWTEPAQIEVMSGAFCMMRHEALNQAGLLDEDFFMYGEDIDLSVRLLKAGWQNWYVPATIVHYKGESTQKSSFRYVHVFYDAMLIFFRKHYGHLSLLISLPIKAAIVMKATVALVRMQTSKARRSLGFFRHNTYHAPLYVFIGQGERLEQCRQLAQRKGLDAQFFEGDAQQLPQGHQTLTLPQKGRVYVVYDVKAYSYQQIFECFAQAPQPNVSMGLYNADTHTIITAEEVLR